MLSKLAIMAAFAVPVAILAGPGYDATATSDCYKAYGFDDTPTPEQITAWENAFEAAWQDETYREWITEELGNEKENTDTEYDYYADWAAEMATAGGQPFPLPSNGRYWLRCRLKNTNIPSS